MQLKLKKLALLSISGIMMMSGFLFITPALGSTAYAIVPASGGGGGDNNPDPAANSGNCSDINKCDLLNKYVTPFINFLTALVGLAVVISIVIGGIQYGSSAGDPSKITAAKNRIRNALLALLTFLFLLALINFIVPGGLY
jgi:hypothetical protein